LIEEGPVGVGTPILVLTGAVVILFAGGATGCGNDDAQSPTPQATATSTPEATPTVSATPTQTETADNGRLAALVGAAETADWTAVEDDRLSYRLLIPPGFLFDVAKWDERMSQDSGVRLYRLTVQDQETAPLPNGQWPDQQTLVSVIFLPEPIEPIPFGEWPSQPLDEATIRVAGTHVRVREQEGDIGPRRVIAEANVAVPGGTLHLLGMAFPADDDERIATLLGMLQSIEMR
jgi:hypothetical protein